MAKDTNKNGAPATKKFDEYQLVSGRCALNVFTTATVSTIIDVNVQEHFIFTISAPSQHIQLLCFARAASDSRSQCSFVLFSFYFVSSLSVHSPMPKFE